MQICGFQKEKKTVVRPNKNRCVLVTKEKQYNFKPPTRNIIIITIIRIKKY